MNSQKLLFLSSLVVLTLSFKFLWKDSASLLALLDPFSYIAAQQRITFTGAGNITYTMTNAQIAEALKTQPEIFKKQISRLVYSNLSPNKSVIRDHFDYLGWPVLAEQEQMYDADLIWSYQGLHEKLNDSQQLNWFRGEQLFENKNRMMKVMRAYDLRENTYSFNSSYFTPLSYFIDFSNEYLSREEQEFLRHPEDGVWIAKPVSESCGRGIQMVYNITKYKKMLIQKQRDGAFGTSRSYKIQMQKYIENPMLIYGRKFDFRCYIQIVSTKPFIALYRHGYVRRTLEDYDVFSSDRFVHLVNHEVQKYHPDYASQKDDMHWTMRRFERYMAEETNYPVTKIYDKIKAVATYALLSAKDKIYKREGDFQIFGFDVMLDDKYNVYLIEINKSPYLLKTTPAHSEVVGVAVGELIDTASHIFDYRKDGLYDLARHKDFVCLYSSQCDILVNDVTGYNYLQDYNASDMIIPEVVFTKKK